MKESETKIPADLVKTLAANPKAKTVWTNLTPIAHRDFISWIESAKQPETRKSRIERVCPMLLEGKRRPCCYAIVPMNLYKALGTNQKAKAVWSSLSPNERRDFADWVESGKTSEERTKRIVKASAMLAKGKRNP